MQIRYRPEIDGLRTIAVLAVIIYHAQFMLGGAHFLKGGFLGVDVFFVISGFLITSIIMKELHVDGKFSFLGFYERRARRILPALFLVILVALPFAWYLLLPTQLTDFAKSILSTLAFGSNFYWDASLQEYGAESALLKPFLHTWSLAVEEQYYIIFPLILIVIYRWFKSYTVVLLTAALLLSLGLSDYVTSKNQSLSFYMLPTRFWELLAGSLLANILYFHPQKENDAFLNKTMPVLGLYLIGYSLFFVDFNSNHPGYITLLPVIGTVLIIWFANEKDLVTQMLSSRLFVGIGLISYSLYLWHYPIFAFGRIIDPSPECLDKSVWIALTAILSLLGYFLIEKPLRNRDRMPSKYFWLAIAITTMVILLVSALYLTDSVKGKQLQLLEELYGKNNPDNQALGKETGKYGSEMRKPWDKSLDNSNKLRLLIVGNSHARDTFNAIFQTPELMQAIDVRRKDLQIGLPKPEFEKLFNSELFEQADAVLVSTRYIYNPKRGHEVHDLDRLDWFIKEVRSRGKHVAIASNTIEFKQIENVPVFEWFVTQTVTLPEVTLSKLYFENIDNEKLRLNLKVQQIAEQNNVPFLDKTMYMCNFKRKECDGLTPEGNKLFYDNSHYTLDGAQYFGKRMYQIGWLDPLLSLARE